MAQQPILNVLSNAVPAPGDSFATVDPGSPLPTCGIFQGSTVQITRPSNTNAYTANFCVGTATGATNGVMDWTFSLGRATATAAGLKTNGYLVKSKLETNQSGCVANFRLHIFNTPITPIGDNTICALLFANNASYVGFLDYPAVGQVGSSSDDNAFALLVPGVVGKLNQVTMPLQTTTDTLGNVYCLLETLTVFTPNSGQIFRIALDVDSN